VEKSSGAGCYFIISALIFGDAICPVLPGETTLNAGCVLAQSGKLSFGLVVLSGASGAIAGDSTLYWIARSAAEGSRTSRRAWSHVPAVREVRAGSSVRDQRHLGGVVRMPYRKFLFRASMSGALWALWTGVSTFLGGALIGACVWVQSHLPKHQGNATEAGPSAA
jgi:membrane protein DedA with SNARE-associated domain